MEKLKISQLATEVATLLGEAISLQSLPAESPFPNIEDRVRILAPGILLNLLTAEDIHFNCSGKQIPGELTINNDGVGILQLPEDFLKIVAIRSSDWKQTVTKTFEASDIIAEMQESRWTGIRGTPERPVIIHDIDSKGKSFLRLYSCTQNAQLATALYLPIPEISSDDFLEFPKALHHSLLQKLVESYS